MYVYQSVFNLTHTFHHQEQLMEYMAVFHGLNKEVTAKETSIDTLIEKGAVLLAEG